jgi:hypothetical protein
MSVEDFHKGGIPTLGILFLLAAWAGVVTIALGFIPRHDTQGAASILVKTFIVLCVVQSVLGMFVLFSPAQMTGLTMAYAPLLGFYGFWTLEPAFLVFFAAVEVYFLSTVQAVMSNLSTCTGVFADNDYCVSGWAVYVSFVTLLYVFIMYAHVFTAFYLFNHLTQIPLDDPNSFGSHADAIAKKEQKAQQEQLERQMAPRTGSNSSSSRGNNNPLHQPLMSEFE